MLAPAPLPLVDAKERVELWASVRRTTYRPLRPGLQVAELCPKPDYLGRVGVVPAGRGALIVSTASGLSFVLTRPLRGSGFSWRSSCRSRSRAAPAARASPRHLVALPSAPLRVVVATGGACCAVMTNARSVAGCRSPRLRGRSSARRGSFGLMMSMPASDRDSDVSEISEEM